MEYAILQRGPGDGYVSILYPDWSEEQKNRFIEENQTGGCSIGGTPEQILEEAREFLSETDTRLDAIMEAIQKELNYMFHGDMREVPEGFLNETAQYVLSDAEDMWNGDDIRMAICNRLYDILINHYGKGGDRK